MTAIQPKGRCKEASNTLLADDNFASIFSAVKEGRIVFDNLRKVTFFLIPTGIAAIISIIGAMIFALPIPYLPAQLLWINLVTNGLQDVALAFEPGEKGIIDRPPRDPKEGIMSRLLVERTVLVGLVISIGIIWNYVTALREGASLENARTVAVTTMVFSSSSRPGTAAQNTSRFSASTRWATRFSSTA